MKAPQTAKELVQELEAVADIAPAQQGAVNQGVFPGFPVDDAILESLLGLAALLPVADAGRPVWAPLPCSVCRTTTAERCSYCLLPVCETHGQRVRPWYTARQVLVCPPCQARLREIEQEELDL